jgi:hypothetical protein
VSAAGAVRAIEQLVDRGGDADDVLRGVVAVLHDEAGYAWAGIFFVEAGKLVLGPAAGSEEPHRRTLVPVTYEGSPVAELAVDGDADRAALERVAQLIAAHCLVGWDTGGERWTP